MLGLCLTYTIRRSHSPQIFFTGAASWGVAGLPTGASTCLTTLSWETALGSGDADRPAEVCFINLQIHL